MKLLLSLTLLLAALSGAAVVLTRSPKRQIFAMGANGLVLTLLFMELQAPDVAFAELIIGAVALPLMFFVVLASTRMDRRAKPEEAVSSKLGSAP